MNGITYRRLWLGPWDPPADVVKILHWIADNSRDVSDLGEAAVTRGMLNAIAKLADGRSAAAGTVQRQRGVLVNLAEYAIERKLLVTNPITSLAWKAPKTVKGVDKRVVVNPDQARALLRTLAAQEPSGSRLVAFFGAMYYSALRPAEAATLRRANLLIPKDGWGNSSSSSQRPLLARRGPTAVPDARSAS